MEYIRVLLQFLGLLALYWLARLAVYHIKKKEMFSLISRGKHQEFIAQASWFEIFPPSIDVWYWLGYAHAKIGAFGKAKDYGRKMIRKKARKNLAEVAGYYFLLARLAHQAGQAREKFVFQQIAERLSKK